MKNMEIKVKSFDFRILQGSTITQNKPADKSISNKLSWTVDSGISSLH